MAEKVIFAPTPGVASAPVKQSVYLRELWSGAWVYEKDIWCEEIALSVMPSMPTATLRWMYGDIQQPGTHLLSRFLRKNIRRFFVKVEYETEDTGEKITFVGTIEQGNDRRGGARVSRDLIDLETTSAVETGDQYFTAYGMEFLLATQQILDAVVIDGGSKVRTDTAPTFNRNGIGNKQKGALAFANDPDNAEPWTSLNIVSYLLLEQSPKKADGSIEIPFFPVSLDIPNWDQPELQQHGATVYELLSQLVTQRRGYAGYFEVALDGTVELKTDTFTESPISVPLPSATPVRANKQPIELIYDQDPQTSGTLKESTVELYDQVIYRGDRRRSVGSFSLHKDGTLEPGWEYARELEYIDGAGGLGAGVKDRRRLDEAARSEHKLREVFTYFRIPSDWDRKVGDGEGGTLNPLFPKTDAFGLIVAEPAFVYYPDLRVEQTMPLIDGVDYSDDKIANATFVLPATERNEAAPMAWMKVPSKEEWRLVSGIARNADLELTDTADEFNNWSAAIRIPRDGKGIYLDVHGAPQHVLDGKGFTYLDTDERLGKWSYRDTGGGMIVTMSIPDDRYCEGRYPETFESDASYIKKKLLLAAGFRQDYVAPGTVVGVTVEGELQRSTGGFIPRRSADDDTKKLEAAAKIAAVYYATPHRVLSLSSYRLRGKSKIRLGSLVVKIGDPTLAVPQVVQSPITEIHITSPMGTPEQSESARMDIMTWAGEIDPLLIAPIEPTDEHSRPTASGLAVGAISSEGAAR